MKIRAHLYNVQISTYFLKTFASAAMLLGCFCMSLCMFDSVQTNCIWFPKTLQKVLVVTLVFIYGPNLALDLELGPSGTITFGLV
jgi:hypothetical protein